MRLFFYLLTLLYSCCSFAVISEPEQKHILVIHSYSLNEPWVRDVNAGIKANLDNGEQISFEYLNSKNISSADLAKYKSATLDYFTLKLSRESGYDAIILVDDFSLDVFLELNNEYFEHIPVVAVGVGKFHSSLPSNIKVFNENIDIAKNIRFIKEILPETKEINVVYDHSGAGRYYFDTYSKIDHMSGIKLNHKRPDYILNLIALVKNDPNIPTLLVLYYKDKNDNLWEPSSVAEILSIDKVRIFSTYGFYIKNNILGGYALSHEALGRLAANYILGILFENIKDPGDDIVTNFYLANVQAFETLSLKNSWPKNTVLLNTGQFGYQYYIFLLVLPVIALVYFFMLRASRKKLSQRDKIIYLLSDVIECRSGETGQHVKNISQMSYLLAKLAGLNKKDCELLTKYSPMHDVGKIGVLDSILNKPGKLTAEEFDEMKLHAEFGYNLLINSGIDDFKIAAVIAYQHHERWDGTGYPNALEGEDISIYARIVSIADVFDALTTERVYKEAWTFEETKKYFENESGKQFDPNLVQIFLQNFNSFVNLKKIEN